MSVSDSDRRALTFQRWDDAPLPCLAGGLIPAMRKVRSPTLPLGRINVSTTRARLLFRVYHPTARTDPRAYQVAMRPACGYGHFMLLFVSRTRDAYLFDPNSGDRVRNRRLFHAICDTFGCTYRGTLDHHLGITVPRSWNTGRHECGVWIAFVYHLLVTRQAARVLALPLVEQRRRLVEFVRPSRARVRDEDSME